MQRLLGHAMVACVVNRSGMAVFRYLYDFVHSGAKPRKLNDKERMECNIFISILPLLVSDIRRPWSSTISCMLPQQVGALSSVRSMPQWRRALEGGKSVGVSEGWIPRNGSQGSGLSV